MKKLPLVIFLVSIFISIGRAQISQPGVNLIKKDGRYKILCNNREYNVNEQELIIKPIPGFEEQLNLEIIHEDKLGFAVIRVPVDRNFEEYAKELWKTGQFDVIEYNSLFEYTHSVRGHIDEAFTKYLKLINMKTTMKSIILLAILITGCSEKESNELENNCLNCESELSLEDVLNLTCKVAKFNDTTYVFTYDSISFVDSGYVAGSEFILVPCGLPDSLKIPETYLNVSGQIVKDCCNLLTLPQIRGGFGCKFYITKIQKLK